MLCLVLEFVQLNWKLFGLMSRTVPKRDRPVSGRGKRTPGFQSAFVHSDLFGAEVSGHRACTLQVARRRCARRNEQVLASRTVQVGVK